MSSAECDQLPSTSIGKWLKRISIIALLMLPLAVLGFRLQLYPFPIALMLLGVSLLIAALVFLIALFVSLKQANQLNAKYANAAMLFSLIPLLFLGSQIIKAKSLPVIHNISTDTQNPPQFNKVIAIRGAGSNPHSYDQAQLAKVQSLAYPDIKTLLVKQSVTQAFNKSLSVVEKLGWSLVSKDQPNGVIEASQTSKLWGFTDDIVIRITPNDENTKIDLRSVSRIGKSDLGANAKRIKKFSDTYSK